ncbi:MAG: hypothetical protein ACE5JX_00055 [Acidobacteriota bacterium]
MITVALVGADGAGKSTVGRRLPHELRLPLKYLYMGVNLDSCNLLLPTTRFLHSMKRGLGKSTCQGGPPPAAVARRRSGNGIACALRQLKSTLWVLNLMAEEWFRQVYAWYCQYRGFIVLLDRHFFCDYYAHDVQSEDRRGLVRRIHGLVLKRFYPRPDLVICLDAPAEVLFARKGEGSVELLEKRRREYLRLKRIVPNFLILDAARPADEVTRTVAESIRNFLPGEDSCQTPRPGG